VDRNRPIVDEHGIRDVLLQDDRAVAERYALQNTPSAVLIGADGRVHDGAALAPKQSPSSYRTPQRR
jgi:hypothetical protein